MPYLVIVTMIFCKLTAYKQPTGILEKS